MLTQRFSDSNDLFNLFHKIFLIFKTLYEHTDSLMQNILFSDLFWGHF